MDFGDRTEEKLDTVDSSFFYKRLWLVRQRRGLSKASYNEERRSIARARRSNNANAPKFERNNYKFSVEENKNSGTLVGTVTATDADIGLAGQLTYSMTATKDTRSDAMFLINNKSGRILTKQKLDRELLGKHEFTLTVKDKGSPVSTDTAKLVITVLDENDNPPTFEQASYSKEIPEDIAIQTTVTTVHASDKDLGDNGAIVYSLSNTGNIDNAFAIDRSSGDIITMKTLDRETIDRYDLTAIATDKGQNNRSASVAVSITLLDVNDSPPKFNKDLYKVKIAEDVAVQTTILTVTAKSADLGINGLVSYSIPESDGRLTIDSTSGDIIVTKALDYEETTFYRLIIQAQDGGVPPLTGTTTVDVQIDNVNDNSPIFQSETVSVIDIAENMAKNSPVTQVTAIDNDDGTFGKITYRITSSDVLDTFSIGSTTGSITTLKELDYESHTSYTINVVAEDGGDPPESGQVTILVNVKDINDESPQFIKKHYRKSVSESTDTGTVVLHVSATDSDFPSGAVKQVRYSIAAGDFGIPFSISSNTGRVRVSSTLDHEAKDMYNFVVMATDGELSNTTEVRIKVLDENDSPPLFKGLPSTVSVPENMDAGTLVYTVTATDNDSGNNSKITFSLENYLDVFSIDPTSGEVTTLQILDYENRTFARLIIVATDGGVPPMQRRTHLNINILDENDNTPVFSTLPQKGTIMENAVIGTMVLTVTATDKDVNGYPLTYSFVENVTAFQIFPTSGLIRTATTLDRESVAEYHLEVQAVDKGELPRTGRTTVTIEVLDINDNPPKFEKQSYAVSIYESKEPSTEVIRVKAVSQDSSVDDADIQYSIQEGNEEGIFEIESQTGSIVLAKQVDAENTPEFLLRVQATAGFHFANVFVQVAVLDLNDNPPLVDPLSIHVNILEGSFDRQIVGSVRARDPDSTSVLVQGLAEELPSPFLEFDNKTGDILVRPGISEGMYVLNTSVSDGVTTVSGLTHVIVRMISRKTINDSVILRVISSTLLSLVDHYHDKIIWAIAKYMKTAEDLIDVYSIQYSTDLIDHFDILFAVRNHDGGYVPRMVVISQLDKHIVDFEKDMGVGIDNVNVDMCLSEPCSNFQDCSNEVTVDNSLEMIRATSVVFHSIHHKVSFNCHCPSGFIHNWDPNGCVEEQNDCLSNPCHNGGSCIDLFDGYRCVCIAGTVGDQCEVICPSEYCNLCDPNPCFNGGSCRVINGVQTKCSCLSGFDGPNCEQTSAHFNFGSWLAFPSLSLRWYFVISFEFATIEQNGLLLFNDRLGPEYDFIAAEIIGGQVVGLLSFGGGAAKVTAQSQTSLADGQWHSVVISVKNQELTVTVENCEGPNAGSQATLGVQYSSKCSVSGRPLGQTRSLDVDSYFYIGGLEMNDFTYPITNTQFSGCMRNIRINDNLLDLSKALQNVRVTSGCPPSEATCTSDTCQNNGICQDRWNGYYCSCSHRFGGQHCETRLESSQLSGQGYIHYHLDQEVFLFKFGVAFRTRQSDATLFQTERSLLRVERGYLRLIFNVSSVEHSLYLTNGSAVNDGLWHDVVVTTLSGTTMSLDYGRYVMTLPSVVTASSRNFYVGGKHVHPRTVVDNFVGCIQGIEVNNHVLLADHSNVTILNNGRTVGVIVTSVGLSKGCQSVDVCSTNSCPANSQCIDEWEAYSCECNSGQRPFCVSPCNSQPCLNNGQCVFDSKSETGFICQCEMPYTGQLCELPEQCELGFYDYPFCRPCPCNREGALDTICDQKTGECLCKKETFSLVGDLGCQPCDCDGVGSEDLTCDGIGQCRCKQFVTGKKCDRCLPGYEGLGDSGCHEAVYVNGAIVLPNSSFWSFLTKNSTSEYQLLSTQLKQDIQTVFTGLHGTQTAVITELKRSTLNTVQALFRVASHDSTDQTTEAPTVNEVISVLSRAAAKGKFDQRFVEQLEISAVCADEPCFPGVVCSDVNGQFQCGTCPERYSGDGILCNRMQDLCKDNKYEATSDIDNDGILNTCDNCEFEFNPEQLDLNSNGIGDKCESTTGVCRSDVVDFIHWPVTQSGQMAELPCPSGQEGLISRKCNSGKWKPPVFANCLSNEAVKLQQQSDELENGKVLQLSESEAFASLLRDVSQGIAKSDQENGDSTIAINILIKLVKYITALAQLKTTDTMTSETIPQVTIQTVVCMYVYLSACLLVLFIYIVFYSYCWRPAVTC
jgi:cadherin EGF LAG seven-pass G-type receptor 1